MADRYALILVDRRTGEPTRYGTYDGEEGADRAWHQAGVQADRGTAAFVVGLRQDEES